MTVASVSLASQVFRGNPQFRKQLVVNNPNPRPQYSIQITRHHVTNVHSFFVIDTTFDSNGSMEVAQVQQLQYQRTGFLTCYASMDLGLGLII